jgi:ABC-2 type transport system permease protein
MAMLLGIVMWNFFTELTNHSLKSIVSKSTLLRKINFPKYIIIISASISALINMSINLTVVLVFIIFSGINMQWSILLTPLYFIEIYLFALGIAFTLSAIYVKYRDISYFWEIIVQALFYVSAILYPITILLERGGIFESFGKLIMLSPITSSIQGARNALINSDLPTTSMVFDSKIYTLIPIILSLSVFVFGALYFRSKSPNFAEEA